MFFVDILDSSGARVGAGPITSGIRWSYTQRLSRAGEWSLEVPLGEEKLAHTILKRGIHCYTRIGEGRRWQGGGPLENMVARKSGNGTWSLQLSGGDSLRELAATTVKFAVDFLATPPLGELVLNNIFATAPAWTFTLPATVPDLVARFVYETTLNALISTIEKMGLSFYLEPFDSSPRNVVVIDAPTDSGIVATNIANPLEIERNLNACLITNIERQQSAWELVNSYTVFGAGDGEARFSLAAATEWPDGSSSAIPYTTIDLDGNAHTFEVNRTLSRLTDTASVATYGTYHQAVSFKDISPVYPTTEDTREAANALLLAAVTQLTTASRPQEQYSLSVAGLGRFVRPGQRIRVVARQVRDGSPIINIDKSLLILETSTEIDTNGARIVGLTVSTSRTFAKSDAELLADQIRRAEAYQAHPQTKPNENTLTYSAEVDADYDATFPFWLSRGTTTVNSVILRFHLDPFRSTAKAIGGEATGSVDIPDHTHTVNISAHDHDIEDHQHFIQIVPQSGGGVDDANVSHGFGSFSNLGYAGSSGTRQIPTNTQDGGTTTEDGGGSSPTSEDGGGQTGLTVDIANALTIEYGVFEDAPANTYSVNDLDWFANEILVTAAPQAISGGFFELDVTGYMVDNLTGRPLAFNNTVRVAPKSTSSTEQRVKVTAQIEIRSTVQSLAVI